MKKYYIYATTFIIMFSYSSCKKIEKIENTGIIGKWQFIEYYNGYVNGGDFKWHSVPEIYSYTLQFMSNGGYLKKYNINGALQNCTGNYLVLVNTNLEVNSTCNTITEEAKISELTPTTLILDYAVIEGTVKNKYIAIK